MAVCKGVTWATMVIVFYLYHFGATWCEKERIGLRGADKVKGHLTDADLCLGIPYTNNSNYNSLARPVKTTAMSYAYAMQRAMISRNEFVMEDKLHEDSSSLLGPSYDPSLPSAIWVWDADIVHILPTYGYYAAKISEPCAWSSMQYTDDWPNLSFTYDRDMILGIIADNTSRPRFDGQYGSHLRWERCWHIGIPTGFLPDAPLCRDTVLFLRSSPAQASCGNLVGYTTLPVFQFTGGTL